MKTIRVTGKGRLSVRPDTTRITLTLEGTDPGYGEILRRSSQETEQLRDLLTEFGFERTDLKTLNFTVDTEYEGYEEEGVYKQRFAGYRFRHLLKVEFPSDNGRLGGILSALAGSPVRPEFQLSYTVRDPEAVKNELLGKAVADARAKADVLAQAAGVCLKDLRSLDYSWGEIDLEVRPMDRMFRSEMTASKAAGFAMDIEPEDIEAEDTVTVVWEIG